MNDEVLQYSHVGRTYLLGYGADFFGLWHRGAPGAPMHRFPRTDDGWRAAWSAFDSLEPERIEVGLTPGGAPTAPTGSRSPLPHTGSGRITVSPAWWLLPIFFGWFGGLIAYLMVRRMDRGMAVAMFALGLLDSLLVAAWLLR